MRLWVILKLGEFPNLWVSPDILTVNASLPGSGPFATRKRAKA